MPVQEEYQVRLDAFCGPLDLLLYLIRQAEVDVTDIPIAQVTDQYLGFLGEVGDIDVDAAGEFLVMAATLMEVKSRMLMPPEPGGGIDIDAALTGGSGAGGDDPRFELIRQLLAYQKYRLASEALTEHRMAFVNKFPARPVLGQTPMGEHEEHVLELEDAHVLDLSEAYDRICAAIDFSRLGDHHIRMDDTPAAEYQKTLVDKLSDAGGRITLQEAFGGQTRLQRLGLFLAALELARLRRLVIGQEDLLAEIVLELNDDPGPMDGDEPAQQPDPSLEPSGDDPPEAAPQQASDDTPRASETQAPPA